MVFSRLWRPVNPDMANHLDVLSNSLENFVAKDFSQKLESSVLPRLDDGMGAIRVSVFNQLSGAINSGNNVTRGSERHLNWSEMTKQIIGDVSPKIIGSFNTAHLQKLEACRSESMRHMSVTKDGLSELKSKEDARLMQVKELVERHQRTERELQRWLNAMNLRVRFQYLYFPVLLFAVAMIWAAVSLSYGFIRSFHLI